MKFTIFTPTHDKKFLARLDKSIAAQTFKDFEWLIVPNGKVSASNIRNSKMESECRIVPYKGKTQNIGEIKKFCCDNAQGEILVEVDHDDELLPNCLKKLAEAFTAGVDFVYSNCVQVLDGEKPRTYDTKFGWKYRPFTWNDKKVAEHIAFPPSPASFSKIWFTPNHVRAWRKEFYNRIGGHDVSMEVLDDHDLLCRTYIYGDVRHIDEPLYIYHNHKENTCQGEKNAFIQSETLNIHDKYIYQMVEKWCDLNYLAKIDLCGGFGKPNGYESVDMQNGDITADLNGRWPFEDGSVGVFRAHDALEHLKDPIHVMKEAYRCLAPNGWFLTNTPSTDGRGAWQDPTHVSFWNSNSFWYYTKKQTAAYIGTPVKFQLSRIKNYFPSKMHQDHNIIYVKADLLKFSGRTPGLIEI